MLHHAFRADGCKGGNNGADEQPSCRTPNVRKRSLVACRSETRLDNASPPHGCRLDFTGMVHAASQASLVSLACQFVFKSRSMEGM